MPRERVWEPKKWHYKHEDAVPHNQDHGNFYGDVSGYHCKIEKCEINFEPHNIELIINYIQRIISKNNAAKFKPAPEL